MSIYTVSTAVLKCDGCGATHGEGCSLRSATEARASAYTEGWRFPPKVNAAGNPSVTTSDVCPACLPEWKPVLTPWSARRTAGASEAPHA